MTEGHTMTPVVHVIATTYEGTRAALAAAVPLAKGCKAELRILVPRIVSCAAELETPADSTAALMNRYQQIAAELGARSEVEVCGSVGLADLLARICAARSHVVVGGPSGRWLTSPEERFANRLARLGCHVLFAASGANATQRRIAA
jgi:hypothetical protein